MIGHEVVETGQERYVVFKYQVGRVFRRVDVAIADNAAHVANGD